MPIDELVAKLRKWADWLDLDIGRDEPAGADCREAAAAMERLLSERDEARLLVTEANNSLYGSQGYFHSLNGGPFDRYHLASEIEALKQTSNRHWHERQEAEAQRDKLKEALTGLVQRFELYAGPDDMHAGNHDLALLNLARQALQDSKP